MSEKAEGNYITEDDVDNWGFVVSASAEFNTEDVNITEDKITVGLDIPTGSKIRFSSTGVLPGGLETKVIYYAIRIDATIIQIASSPVNAAADPPIPIDITGAWEIDFPSGWGAPDQIVIPELMSWSDSDHEGVKYFSGIATYNKKFDIPGGNIDDGLIISIDLGKVREVVEIYLNGENMGILWKPPYQKDITRAVRAGENTLTLEVANTWSNRLTGDGLLPEGERYTKTNITGPDLQKNTLWKDAPLLESGLIGPVSIQFARKITIN